jgi:hypothetical protein
MNPDAIRERNPFEEAHVAPDSMRVWMPERGDVDVRVGDRVRLWPQRLTS